MSLRLHWSPDSANLVIRIALEMLDLPFEAVRLNRGQGDHKSAAYLAKNPQGLIPVLEDGERVLFETGAILWHVAERAGRFGPEGPLVTDDVARAAALKWVFYISNTIHADLRVAFYADRYVEDVAVLRAGVAQRMRGHFDLIEDAVRGGLLGDAVTVIDVYLAICARWAQLYPAGGPLVDDLSAWPKLQALCARIESDPAIQHAFTSEFIPGAKPITDPRPPELPASEVTGVV